MKQTIYLISIACLLMLNSCDDAAFLNKAPYSFTSPENYYQTLSDFEGAVTGCYQGINNRTLLSDDVSYGTYNSGLQFMLSAGNDELIINSGGGGKDYEKFATLLYTPENDAIEDFWKAYYAGIMRCNYLISKAKSVNLDDQERLDDIVGEAHFLRAFYYYHFALLFGGVPMNTEPVSSLTSPRVSLERLYTELILPDLELAYSVLPETPSIAGRACKYSAAGYLGVIYNYLASCKRNSVGGSLKLDLNKFDWVNEEQASSDAKMYLAEIIGKYQLIDNYDYLFRETTKSYQQQECLFSSEESESITEQYPNVARLFCPGGNTTVYGGGWQMHRPVYEFVLSYDSSDKRLAHNVTNVYTAKSETETIDGVEYYVPLPSPSANYWRNCASKYRHMNPAQKVIPTWASGISIPLLRYADVLLQYAEAIYFSDGDEVEARQYFTPIRARSVVDTVDVSVLNVAYYKVDFIEELLDERKRELCFESKRRIDLIRFGKMQEVIFALDPDASSNNSRVKDLQENWADYKIWFPLPQREIDLNRNLIQNDNY